MAKIISSYLQSYKKYKGRFTFTKLLNYFLVFLSLKLKSSKVFGKPVTLFLEPTNICNLECPLCPTGNKTLTKKRGIMNLEDYKKVIDNLKPYLFSVTLWNYGEPFINKDSFEMIKYASQNKIKAISSTNGYLFYEKDNLKKIIDSGLDILIVSLDGTNQKTLNQYRKNAKFNKLIEGIRSLSELKKEMKVNKPFIEAQFIVMKHNEHQIEDIKKLAKEIGANQLILKTVNIFMSYGVNPKEAAKRFLPKNPEYLRNTVSEKFVITNGCPGLWFGTNIDYDGKVIPCCFDPYETQIFGNAFQENILKIWNNKEYVEFRKKILKNKASIPICARCPTNVKSYDIARIDFE